MDVTPEGIKAVKPIAASKSDAEDLAEKAAAVDLNKA